MICSLIRPSSSPPYNSHTTMVADNIGALIIKIGFWGPLYYMYCKERPPPQKKNSAGNYYGPEKKRLTRAFGTNTCPGGAEMEFAWSGAVGCEKPE